MIEHVAGNLIEADAEALVNSVNTVGVMGKGVALQFKQAFPDNYKEYLRACKHGEVQPGRIFVHKTGGLTNPRYILNFPTKRHWKGKSRMSDIESGLDALVKVIQERGITSVAVPPLGCGNGGLLWQDVLPKIEAAFRRVPEVKVLLYSPEGAPRPERMKVATTRPRLTAARAALLGLLKQYALPGYNISMLEVQKLAYFLQEAGEPLKLKFNRGSYGPYAEAHHFVLQRLEGHFIRGYGDRSAAVSIKLLPSAAAAESSLAANEAVKTRFERVARLIEGFETPYGLELLATVHRVGREDPKAREDPDLATVRVHNWSDRKAAQFNRSHVHLAWARLRNTGWL